MAAFLSIGGVATVRERRPGVWQVRVFTGRNADGAPTQVAGVVGPE